MIEIWRDIKGFEGEYQISNLGRARSLDRVYFNTGNGRLCKLSGKVLAERLDSDGYVCFSIKKTYPKAHRLVMQHFGEPAPDDHTEVDHVNGNRADNRIENLRWATVSLNRFNQHQKPRSNSGFRGVSWCEKKNKYRAYITVNRRFKTLGYFCSVEEAVISRVNAEQQFFGFSNQ